MMNSKYLVLILFAVWSAICWNWYVCGIKDACSNKTPKEAAPIIEEIPAIESDTQAVADVIRPLKDTDKNKSSKVGGSPNTHKGNYSPNVIDKVQLESVEDYMVVHFPYNSIRKEDNASMNAYLSKLAQELIATNKTVSITGHTDFVGDAKSNIEFGQKRANSIRDILIKKGVKKGRIKCNSMGDKKPVATNDTPQGRYKNRRVVIKVQN